MLKVKSHLPKTMNSQEVIFLVILDLSAAFDIVCHGLLNQLYFKYGFDGTTLNCISIIFKSRIQQVLIGDNTFSKPAQLQCGVPQGSVLGLILLPAPVGKVCGKHRIIFHHMQMTNKTTYPSD